MRELFPVVMFGVIVVAIRGGISVSRVVVVTPRLVAPLVIAGRALNISYALFGTVLAWAFQHATTSVLAVVGCLIVTAGAAATIMSGEKQDNHHDERQPP